MINNWKNGKSPNLCRNLGIFVQIDVSKYIRNNLGRKNYNLKIEFLCEKYCYFSSFEKHFSWGGSSQEFERKKQFLFENNWYFRVLNEN